MIIGIDIRSLMEGRHSGVEEYAIKIIRAMIRQAPNNQWILFYNSWRAIQLPDFGPAATVVSWRYPNKLLNLWQFAGGRPQWDTMIEIKTGLKPAVIFVPNARLLPLAGTPLVVTAHDLSYELFPEFYSWQRRLWHKLIRPQRLLRAAKKVIAVSQATKDDVVRLYGVEAENVIVVYSGVEAPAPTGMDEESGARLERYTGDLANQTGGRRQWPEKFILYLGTLEPRKNIVSVIEAFARVAEKIPHHLIIAGERGWLEEEARHAAARSKAREKIHQVGYVTEAEKYELYKRATLFIYPSFYEGFGFPPLEALMAGTPVITSNNSSLPEVAGDFAAMINPYDVSELALIMEEMAVNPPVVPAETIKEISRRFSWETAARQTLEVLEQAARARGDYIGKK